MVQRPQVARAGLYLAERGRVARARRVAGLYHCLAARCIATQGRPSAAIQFFIATPFGQAMRERARPCGYAGCVVAFVRPCRGPLLALCHDTKLYRDFACLAAPCHDTRFCIVTRPSSQAMLSRYKIFLYRDLACPTTILGCDTIFYFYFYFLHPKRPSQPSIVAIQITFVLQVTHSSQPAFPCLQYKNLFVLQGTYPTQLTFPLLQYKIFLYCKGPILHNQPSQCCNTKYFCIARDLFYTTSLPNATIQNIFVLKGILQLNSSAAYQSSPATIQNLFQSQYNFFSQSQYKIFFFQEQ